MIGGLKGKVIYKDDNTLLLDVSGVCYKIFCALTTLNKIMVDKAYFFFIETSVAEDHIKLYGFETRAEQNWFITLSSVQGVGAKAAFNILSASSLEEISNGILFADVTAFIKAQGVGPKLAQRVVNELQNKKNLPATYDPTSIDNLDQFLADDIKPIDTSEPEKAPKKIKKISAKQQAHINKRKAIDGASSALVNLGYQKTEAMQAIIQISEDKEDVSEADLIRDALKYIAQIKEGA